jgi:hypothetical protein
MKWSSFKRELHSPTWMPFSRDDNLCSVFVPIISGMVLILRWPAQAVTALFKTGNTELALSG